MTKQPPPLALFDAASRELEPHRDTLIEIQTTPPTLMVIIAALQLALRHPGYPRRSREELTRITRLLQEHLAHLGPASTTLLEMGWDPQYDYQLTRTERQAMARRRRRGSLLSRG